MPTVHGTVVDAAEAPVEGATVVIRLIATSPESTPGIGFIGANDESIISQVSLTTDAAGEWSTNLVPNDLITPANTYYLITERADVTPRRPAVKYRIEVPDGGGPYWAGDLVVYSIEDLPELIASEASAVSFNPTGIIAATNVQAAIAELEGVVASPDTNTLVDAKGDLLAGTASDTLARLAPPAGADYFLTSDPSAATGLAWDLSPVYNVKGKRFGAVGNGVANDTVAVQAALDAAKAAGGGTVYFPAGTYLTPTGWVVTVAADTSLPIRLQGESTSFLKTSSAVVLLDLSCTLGGANLRRIRIDGLGFNANHASATGLRTRAVAYSQFTNVDFIGTGVATDLGSGAAGDIGLQMSNVRMTAVKRGLVLNANYSLVTNLAINEGISGADAINVSGTGNVVDGFTVRGAGGTGGNAAVELPSAATHCVLANGIVFESYTTGIFVGGGRANKILGVTVLSSQGHGMRFVGALQPHVDVALQQNSAAGVGSFNQLNVESNTTDGFFRVTSIGTNPSLDINEASGVNNTYELATMPNGVTIGATARLNSPDRDRFVGALLAFYGATAVARATTAGAAATFAANTSAIANDTATFDGYTIGQVVKALRNVGLLT